MDEPVVVRLYFVGHHGLSDVAKEGLYYFSYSCIVHDDGLRDLPDDCARVLPPVFGNFIFHRWIVCIGLFGGFLLLEEKFEGIRVLYK